MNVAFDRFSFLKAVFLSAGVHAAVCLLFVFTLSPRAPVFQPYFVSLGAILASDDVRESSLSGKRSAYHLNDDGVLSGQSQRVRLHDAARLDKPKNMTGSATLKKSKKTLFDADFPQQKPPTREELERLSSDLGLEPMPEYAPLRFQTR